MSCAENEKNQTFLYHRAKNLLTWHICLQFHCDCQLARGKQWVRPQCWHIWHYRLWHFCLLVCWNCGARAVVFPQYDSILHIPNIESVLLHTFCAKFE